MPKFDECVRYAAISDIGMRRQNNQDSLNAMLAPDPEYWQQRGHLFVVADGMGAHAAGELASKLAADDIPMTYGKHTELEPAAALQQAIIEANRKINQKGRANSEFQGMGTTCSSLLLLPAGAVIGHVGDSRIYRLRGDVLDQMTFDHSLVWEMRATGKIPAGADNIHLPKNIITRSLGPNSEVQVDVEGPLPIKAGDVYLLCSDGLTGPITDLELAAVLKAMPPDDAVRTLVDLANLRGGPDNITVIVVQVVALPGEAVDIEMKQSSKLSPTLLLLGLASVFLLAAVALFFVQYKLLAFLCAAVALVGVIVAILQRLDTATTTDGGTRAAKMGAAPYVSFDAGPAAEVVEEFHRVARELQSSAIASKRQVDWQKFEQRTAAAESARQQGDLVAAVRHFGGAISFAVEQLKQQGSTKSPSDSHVDLL